MVSNATVVESKKYPAIATSVTDTPVTIGATKQDPVDVLVVPSKDVPVGKKLAQVQETAKPSKVVQALKVLGALGITAGVAALLVATFAVAPAVVPVAAVAAPWLLGGGAVVSLGAWWLGHRHQRAHHARHIEVERPSYVTNLPVGAALTPPRGKVKV